MPSSAELKNIITRLAGIGAADPPVDRARAEAALQTHLRALRLNPRIARHYPGAASRFAPRALRWYASYREAYEAATQLALEQCARVQWQPPQNLLREPSPRKGYAFEDEANLEDLSHSLQQTLAGAADSAFDTLWALNWAELEADLVTVAAQRGVAESSRGYAQSLRTAIKEVERDQRLDPIRDAVFAALAEPRFRTNYRQTLKAGLRGAGKAFEGFAAPLQRHIEALGESWTDSVGTLARDRAIRHEVQLYTRLDLACWSIELSRFAEAAPARAAFAPWIDAWEAGLRWFWVCPAQILAVDGPRA